MCGDTTLGHLVHTFGANLNLHPVATTSGHRSLQRLIAVALGNRHPVPQPLGVGHIEVRHHRIDTPTSGFFLFGSASLDDDTDSIEVVHLVEGYVAFVHLIPDGEDTLGARLDVVFHTRSLQFRLDGHDEFCNECVALLLGFGQTARNILVVVGLQIAQRQIFELAFERIQAELMGDFGIKVQALPALLGAFSLGEDSQRAHNLQSIGKLNEDDSRVGRIANDKFAGILGLLVRHLGVNVRDIAQASGDGGTRLTKLRTDLLGRHQTQTHHVVHNCRDCRVTTESDIRNHDFGRTHRVVQQWSSVVACSLAQHLSRTHQCTVNHLGTTRAEIRSAQLAQMGISFEYLFHTHCILWVRLQSYKNFGKFTTTPPTLLTTF